jgi:hypothetical protein
VLPMLGAMLGAILLTACAATHPLPPVATVPPPPPDYSADIAAMRGAMNDEIPGNIRYDDTNGENWTGLAQAAFSASPYKIESPQLIVAVDRNPSVQQLRLILAVPQGAWAIIGGGKVSTGRAGRFDYYITPTGIFPHSDSILDYRALGTYNENHIRGLGLKGSRVWDFGWQIAEKGWEPGDVTGEIRLLIHATDPAVLEPRLGRPDSKGCVRVSAVMNSFLDRHAVLDADYLRDAPSDPAAAAVLSPDLTPVKYPGRYLVIFDSSAAPIQ